MLKAIVLTLALLLAGCATTPNVIRLTDGQGTGIKVVREVDIDPTMLTGLPWTEAVRKGQFIALYGNFPMTAESWAEWDPLRIRYQAHAVGRDGREYTAHAVFAGYIECLPRLFVLVEGLESPTTEVKAIVLSTLLDRGYTLRGEEVSGFDAGKFQTDAKFRRELVWREGTPLSGIRPVTKLHESILANWSVYNTKGGQIVSPLRVEQLKFLAGINPQYSYWEKVIGTARVGMSLDYVGTSVGLALDLIMANQAKTVGFDHASFMSRRRQGYNVLVLESLMREGIESCLTFKGK